MSGEWTIEDVWASGDWPTEVAIYRIITAPTVGSFPRGAR